MEQKKKEKGSLLRERERRPSNSSNADGEGREEYMIEVHEKWHIDRETETAKAKENLAASQGEKRIH